ncbi:MAG: ParB/RepB/Spo0J family partition protein [Christensenellales bacterium]|jgi:ParB family chromosome partitioning protein
MSKKRIGKGLSTLLSNIEDASLSELTLISSEEGEKIYEAELAKIIFNPNQPRKYFGKEELEELAQSIREYGLLQPIIVQKRGDSYIVVAGERRVRAAKLAGLDKIPVIVKALDERQAKEVSLIENLQREDLNAIEEAEALKELIDLYGLTQAELADKVGKARPSVTNSLRLLSLCEEVKELVRKGSLSAGHARCLISVQDEEKQLQFAAKIINNGLSVRQAERMVRVYLNPELQKKALSEEEKQELEAQFKGLLNDMKRIFATKVSVTGNKSKGRIYIDYYSQDDLARIFELVEVLKNNRL